MKTIADYLPRNVTFAGQRGGASQDFLQGGIGHDVLVGGGGADALVGDPFYNDGGKRDILVGGAGEDYFYFEFPPVTGQHDIIMDFKHGEDFMMPNITALDPSFGSVLSAENFTYGRRPDDADDFVIYRRKTGAVFIDQDGTGPAPTVMIAVLANKAKIDHGDFIA